MHILAQSVNVHVAGIGCCLGLLSKVHLSAGISRDSRAIPLVWSRSLSGVSRPARSLRALACRVRCPAHSALFRFCAAPLIVAPATTIASSQSQWQSSRARIDRSLGAARAALRSSRSPLRVVVAMPLLLPPEKEAVRPCRLPPLVRMSSFAAAFAAVSSPRTCTSARRPRRHPLPT
jgi:hypothetical protein